jgi:tRNA G18 (ribose-2'-O)-methylase SpoU
MQGHRYGTRCPACKGNTRLILTRQLITESNPARPVSASHAHNEVAVLLDNVRSAWNVGSIFRSADGFGFDHAFLCGISPTPENEAVQKTSLGAENTVTWSHHMDAVKLVNELKKEGWKIYALEDDERAKEISSASSALRSARGLLIVGNEVTGVDPELLDLCDEVYYIPMRGEKKSFNVAMAFSIAAYILSI